MVAKKYKYIIVGGGMTGDIAVKGIRDFDEDGSIAMFSIEKNPPYSRPPLTKGLWTGDESLEEIHLETKERGVDIFLETKIIDGDPEQKTLTDQNQNTYNYEKLLLATGGIARKLPNIENSDIIYYRTIEDYRTVKRIADEKEKITIIGGGFIGSEIAASLKMYNSDLKITMVFPESGIGGLIFPKSLSIYLTEKFEEHGIEIKSGQKIKSVKNKGNKHIIKLDNKTQIKADAIIAGIGIEPNTNLAQKMGIDTNNGILVNEYLETNQKDVYAAGDVIRFYSPHLDEKIRVEHEDNALWTGETAGDNMAGGEYKYEHLPMFYSDLFEDGYEAVGVLSSKMEIIADWIEPFKKGIIYYLKDGNARGVLLWNVWERSDEAREIIQLEGPLTEQDLKGKIEE